MKYYFLLLLLAIHGIAANGQPGSVDTAFGLAGIFHTNYQKNFKSPPQISQQVLADPDGSFYVAVNAGAIYISHRFSNGALDSDYGEEGYACPLVAGIATLILQPDRKILAGGVALVNNKKLFTITRITANGAIDKSFGTNGTVYTDFPASSENKLIDLALQPDGKIIAMGSAQIGNSTQLALARYLPNGIPDNSFSDDGRQINNFSGWLNALSSVAIDKQGKIVVAGSTVEQVSFFESIASISVVRFLTDGKTDSSFLSPGEMKIRVGGSSTASDVAIQQDGKIVIAGQTSGFQPVVSALDIAVIRLNINGSLDSSFSNDGIQTTNYLANRDEAIDVAINSSGKIFVAGLTTPGIIPGVIVVSYFPDGTLDDIFTGASGTFIWPTSMALQQDGRILISGYAHNTFVPDYWVLRFDTAGSLDAGFGTNGRLSDYKPNAPTEYFASVIQPDGKIIAAGSTHAAADADFAIVRYNKQGKPDPDFSDDGKVIISFGDGDDIAYAIALQSDGKILVAGLAFNGTDRDVALTRLNPDGSLDVSFSGDGSLMFDYNGNAEEAAAVAFQPDGKILIGGNTSNAGNHDFLVLRFLPDGTPDNDFSEDGLLLSDLGSTSDSLVDIMILADGKIIAVGNYNGNGKTAFSVARYNADGSPDLSFNGTGMIITDPGSGSNVAAAAALQPDGKLIVAGSSSGHDFFAVRYGTDGLLDSSFSDDGKLTFDMGSDSETATALSLQANGKILMAGYLQGVFNTDFAIARFNRDGVADSLFSENGKAVIDGGFGNDRINSLVISSRRFYAVGRSDHVVATGVVTAFLLEESNKPPIAGAYLQKYISPASILLAAWGSYDPDGALITYLWRKVGVPVGDTSQLLYENSASPVINGVITGSYTFRLTVADSDGDTATTMLQFAVQPNQPPVAGTWLQKYYSPTSVLLAAWGSYDPEGWPIKYWWQQTAGPEGPMLLYGNSASPVVTGLVNGTYSYLLTVTDFYGATASSTLTFTVNINLPPIAGAWLQKYYSPTSALLAAWDSHDPEGGPITYYWEKTAGPEGSTLLYWNSASPIVNGLVNGVYTYKLTVTDDHGATGWKELTFTVSGLSLSNNSGLTGVSEETRTDKNADRFIIHPNPVKDILQFKWVNDYNGDAELVIINMTGQQIKSIHISKTAQMYYGTIELNGLKAGQYYLHVNRQNKQTFGGAFFKE